MPAMDSDDTMSAAASRRQALFVLGATFLLTRLVLGLVAILVEVSVPLAAGGPTYSSDPILASLTGSDSVFLLGIAAEGYHSEPIHDGYQDWAFFPLYPLVVRLLSFATLGRLDIAGVLVANGATALGAWLLYRMGERRLGHQRALLAAVYLLIAPGAVAFGMAYTDSLFLVLALASFMAAERRRWGWMGFLYALATLTRLPGVFLGIPLAIIWWRSGPAWWSAWSLALGPLALAGFTVHLRLVVGEWFAFLRAQSAWNNPVGAAASGSAPGTEPLLVLLVAVIAIYLFLLVYIRTDRLDGPSTALVIVSLATVAGAFRILSVARYLAVVWPFTWLVAGRGPWTAVVWPAVSSALFTVFAFLNFAQVLAP
jgi:hypothetical protein